MSGLETLIFLTLLHVYYGVLALKFITAAGHKSWEALLPFYNIYIMTKVIQRPWWWTILTILPGVGNVMIVVIFFELMHMYRIANRLNTFLGVITFGLYFGYLGFSKELKYQERDLKLIRKYISEGFASIIFAVVAATLIRAYTFEAFTIPTPSMEKSMMVGDFLFVSKLQYGSRLPMTPFSLPLMHNRVPFTEIKSFSDVVKFPYTRLPKISDVERNDPVVFNYPVEDHLPVDKREHYVKRCLALPGDTLQIADRKVIINGKENQLPARADRQFQYFVRTQQFPLNPEFLKTEFDINFSAESGDVIYFNGQNLPPSPAGFHEYLITISDSKLEAFKAQSNVNLVIPINSEVDHSSYGKDFPANLKLLLQQYPPLMVNSEIFPNPANSQNIPFKWTRDNYGPIYIPKAGMTVELTPNNYYLYKRIIEVYEGNTFRKEGNDFYINGEKQNEYSFQQNYYWMMGDNRHNSLDSRYWGFVPEDHIVGKPVFIWMSYDKYASGLDMIRTDRIFTTVSGDSERTSYFWPFAIVVALGYGLNFYRKKRKSA